MLTHAGYQGYFSGFYQLNSPSEESLPPERQFVFGASCSEPFIRAD